MKRESTTLCILRVPKIYSKIKNKQVKKRKITKVLQTVDNVYI